MRTGILIPTRGGDRQRFVDFAREQLTRQTRQPDEVLFFDEAPATDGPDITYRYRKGCEILKARGCDAIIFWEDDDYYRPTYIADMMEAWEANGRPQILGINSTIYYNIFTRKWALFNHPGRASMMSTMISTKALHNFKWPPDTERYTDIYLWRHMHGKAIEVVAPWCIGIKHGIGLCGGGGHVNNWPSFNKYDPQYETLRGWTDEEAVNFYTGITMEIQRYRLSAKPFLSIITRRMHGHRDELFAQHRASVAMQSSTDFEQIFIIDRVGVGMLNANKSFAFAHPVGEWVYLLDDDDFFVAPDFVLSISQWAKESNADVLFFKMKIRTGDGDEIYPKPQSWNTRQPKRGQIGGSCFAVKRWVFEKYIRHFGHPSFGDWHFITRVLSDPEIKTVWIDSMMAETGKVSRGAKA